MVDESQLRKIISEESDDTFDSFTDLDGISDTTVLAITFLLSAQVSLSAVVLDSQLLAGSEIKSLFIIFGVVTMVVILLSLNSIIKALFPVGFYSEDVAQPLLQYPFVPIGNSKPDQFDFLEAYDGSDDTDEREWRVERILRNARRKITIFLGCNRQDDPEYSSRDVAEEFVDGYSAFDDIDDFESYKLAKHHHFKQVGSRKAKYTAIGLAWLRLSVLLFVIQFSLLLGGVLLL